MKDIFAKPAGASRRAFFVAASLALCATLPSGAALAKTDTLAEIKNRKELLVGVEPGFIPFEMKKPNGEWIGFDIEMMTAFAQELGVKAKFIDTKWDGIIPALSAKKFDVIVSGMTITEERAKVVSFSEPYYRAGLKILVAKKSADKIKKAEDLNSPQFTVAVKLGTTGDFHVAKAFKNAQIRKLDSESDCANSVALGKVDAFVYDKPYIDLFAKRNEGKVVPLADTITQEDLGLAVRKNDKVLLDAFNAFLKKWKESGAYDKAIKSNFVDMPWLKDFPELK